MKKKNRTILIAEDSATQAEMLRYVLEGAGYEVVYGANGTEAFTLARSCHPALIVSDILMPGMDGYELCAAVKADPELQGIPVLLLTTLSSPRDLIRGLHAGADSYLVKPIDEAELLSWTGRLIHPAGSGISEMDPRLENFLVATYQTALTKNEELKSLHGQLHDLNRQLQQRVSDRTESLRAEIETRKQIETELIRAKEEAEQANRLKTAFLNNLSHEIRTPMNAILGFSTFMADPDLTPDQRSEFAAHIETGCNNLLGIIDSIVDLAVIEAEGIKPRIEECRIAPFFLSIRNDFLKKEKVPLEKIEFRLSVPDTDEEFIFLTDRVRLRQVMVNLLKNALKFTETGFIELGYTLDSPGSVEFFIRDSGTGIPANKLDLIFEKFIKLEEFHTKKYSGTGVGLTITKKLVEFLGGAIRVESEIGKGSVFTVTLPLNRPERTREEPQIPVVKGEDEEMVWNDKLILVAEDVESNFQLLEQFLRKTNAQIRWARNGKEVVDSCSNGAKIDLILMDIQMPVMDGYAALEEIRRIGLEVPVIAQTAYALSHDRGKILEAGFTDLITKPIRASELLGKIAVVFDSNPSNKRSYGANKS